MIQHFDTVTSCSVCKSATSVVSAAAIRVHVFLTGLLPDSLYRKAASVRELHELCQLLNRKKSSKTAAYRVFKSKTRLSA